VVMTGLAYGGTGGVFENSDIAIPSGGASSAAVFEPGKPKGRPSLK
jgi:hypothetical protein